MTYKGFGIRGLRKSYCVSFFARPGEKRYTKG
jgi:hypothetical protein